MRYSRQRVDLKAARLARCHIRGCGAGSRLPVVFSPEDFDERNDPGVLLLEANLTSQLGVSRRRNSQRARQERKRRLKANSVLGVSERARFTFHVHLPPRLRHAGLRALRGTVPARRQWPPEAACGCRERGQSTPPMRGHRRLRERCAYYSLALLFRCVAISFFTSSGVSFGRSMVSVSLLSLPVKRNGT
jgi:hypothetical protein